MYTINQQKALIFSPIITGVLSFISSGVLMISILRNKAGLLRKAVQRIIFGFCVYDIIMSFASSLTTFVAPKGQGLYAVGTSATCDMQG